MPSRMMTESAQYTDALARAVLASGVLPTAELQDPAVISPLLQAYLQMQMTQPAAKQYTASYHQPQQPQAAPVVGTPPSCHVMAAVQQPAGQNPYSGLDKISQKFQQHQFHHQISDDSADDSRSRGSQDQLDTQSESSLMQLATPTMPPVDPATPLSAIWVFWASWKLETEQVGCVEDTRPIGECQTMGEFWDGFGRLLVADMPVNVSLQLLRKGVPPMYDHPENRNGGHFKIRAASMAAACTLWSQLTFAIAREQFPYADQIQGCNVVKKLRSTTLQVWVVNSLFKATVEAIRLFLLTSLPRGDYLRLKFCPHKYLLRTLQTKRAQRGGRGSFDAYDDY